jgi:multiple sugar transport system substrate-binding protein
MAIGQRQIIIIGGLVVFIILILIIFSAGSQPQPPPKLTLIIWGIESRSNFDPLIQAYKSIRQNVEVRYEELNSLNYNKKILESLASGQGPDIFMIRSKDLISNISKIYPIPETQLSLYQLRKLFPQVVEDDFVYQNNIYALPLYIDTLALFYNQDYFARSQIVFPPKNWDEFLEYAQKLKVLDASSGRIVQAGAAIGSSEKNISYATSILKILMKQVGIKIINEFGRFDFGGLSNGGDVINFYTSFSNQQSSNYVWPKDFKDSIDSFSSGNVAMIFAYQSDVSKIKNKAPYLNFRTAPMPQIKDSKINYAYADYWGLTVSRQSKNPTWAWDFIINITANESLAKSYMDLTQKPPALNSLISKTLNDSNLGVFSSQSLIARSWHEIDSAKINEILNNIIDGVVLGKFDSRYAIKFAEEQANKIIINNY